MARILIAEDDTAMRQFLALALEKAGHEPTLCENGIAALRAIETTGPYDLLLSDIVMPGMDGIELSKRAASVAPGLKIMFITGFTGVAVGQGENNTQSPVLSKPFHLKELVDRVESLLAA